MCLPYKLAVRRSSTKFAGNWIGFTRYIAICHIGKFVRWHLMCCGEGPLFDEGGKLDRSKCYCGFIGSNGNDINK